MRDNEEEDDAGVCEDCQYYPCRCDREWENDDNRDPGIPKPD